jgi:hypothetical protein
LGPERRRKRATAGEATMAWKTPSETHATARRTPCPQRKKERMLSIEAGQKHVEEKGGGVTQISPKISGGGGEKGTREEN